MSLTITVDYENIPGQSSQARNIGMQINEILLDVYRNVTDMHNFWYGKRYNDIVTNFNSLVPQLNNFLEIVVSEIPYIFEKIVNNFSEVDIKQNMTVAQKESVQQIQTIPLSTEVGMKYIQGEVANIQNAIESDFHEIISLMSGLENTINQIGIEYETADNFKSQFKSLANSFRQFIENLERQFTNAMNVNRTQIQKAESGNTI